MSLSILNNIPSLVAQNQLQVTNSNLQNTLFQLSSGSRINTGADDAAGLAIANGLQANISALQQSSHNASDGVGKLQVADGALAQVTSLLNRAVTLATESATSTVSQLQRQALNAEFTSISAEINRIGNATNFNGTAIFSNGQIANPNSLTTTATSNLTAGTLLTPATATTVSLGSSAAYTFTPTAAAHTNLNAVIGATATTGITAIADGQSITVSASGGARSYTYTAAGGTGSVTQMMSGINAANKGFTAFLDANGKVNIVDGQGTNNLTISANTVVPSGAMSNTQTGSTVQDLIDGINASGLGVSAGLANVTNPNQLSGATSVTTGTALAAGTLTFHAGTADPSTGLFADTVSFTASGGGTVQDLINGINSSGKGFYASLSGGASGTLQIVDNNYNGNVAVTANSMNGVIGAVGAGAATSQLVITDPLGRGILNVTNADAALGFDAGAGGNSSGFYKPLAAGSSATTVFISDGQVGSSYNTISVSVGQLDSGHLGTQSISSDTLYAASNDAASIAAAKTALTDLNTAISQVASLRGGIGAGINRLTSAVNVMNTQVQNLTSAASSIKDADIGQVVANMSKYQVLEQTGISSLAQANQQEQAVLKLLQ